MSRDNHTHICIQSTDILYKHSNDKISNDDSRDNKYYIRQ